MDLACQRLDLLGQGLVLLGQRGIRLEQQLQIGGLLLDRRLTLLDVTQYLFTVRLKLVECVLVSVCLAGLREQDQRRCVGGLCGEGEV